MTRWQSSRHRAEDASILCCRGSSPKSGIGDKRLGFNGLERTVLCRFSEVVCSGGAWRLEVSGAIAVCRFQAAVCGQEAFGAGGYGRPIEWSNVRRKTTATAVVPSSGADTTSPERTTKAKHARNFKDLKALERHYTFRIGAIV